MGIRAGVCSLSASGTHTRVRRRHKSPRQSVGLVEVLEARTLLSAAAGYTFTTLDPPGSNRTVATGISGSTIVGYDDGDSNTNGFIYTGSTYTTLDVPGARETYATGVSGNTVVGFFNKSVVPDAYGFIYDGSTFTTLDVPGADHGAADRGTTPSAISGNTVVGWFIDGGEHHGFIYDGTTFTTLDVPGASQTQIFGVAGGTVVGTYEDLDGNYHGFIYNGSAFTTLNVPGALSTRAWGISGGIVVGDYYPSDLSGIHGFIYNASAFATLDFPGGNTQPEDISSDGTVVGTYNDQQGHTHGFIATPALAGDLNLDGAVNFSDLLILAQNYGRSGASPSDGDIDDDGAVGFSDLLLLAQNYGKGRTPGHAAAPTAAAGAVPQFEDQWELKARKRLRPNPAPSL